MRVYTGPGINHILEFCCPAYTSINYSSIVRVLSKYNHLLHAIS